MKKEELIFLHTFLFSVKEYFLRKEENDVFFIDYDKLGVFPRQIIKSKEEHQKAVFVLAKCLGSLAVTKMHNDGKKI